MLRLLSLILTVAVADATQWPPPAHLEPRSEGFGWVKFENQVNTNFELYIDGEFACIARGGGYCMAQAPVGDHEMSIRNWGTGGSVERPTNVAIGERAVTKWKVYGNVSDYPTTAPSAPKTLPMAAPGFGAVEFKNGTEKFVDFGMDGEWACRARPRGKCVAFGKVGSRYLYAMFVGELNLDVSGAYLDVLEGKTTRFKTDRTGRAIAPE